MTIITSLLDNKFANFQNSCFYRKSIPSNYSLSLSLKGNDKTKYCSYVEVEQVRREIKSLLSLRFNSQELTFLHKVCTTLSTDYINWLSFGMDEAQKELSIEVTSNELSPSARSSSIEISITGHPSLVELYKSPIIAILNELRSTSENNRLHEEFIGDACKWYKGFVPVAKNSSCSNLNMVEDSAASRCSSAFYQDIFAELLLQNRVFHSTTNLMYSMIFGVPLTFVPTYDTLAIYTAYHMLSYEVKDNANPLLEAIKDFSVLWNHSFNTMTYPMRTLYDALGVEGFSSYMNVLFRLSEQGLPETQSYKQFEILMNKDVDWNLHNNASSVFDWNYNYFISPILVPKQKSYTNDSILTSLVMNQFARSLNWFGPMKCNVSFVLEPGSILSPHYASSNVLRSRSTDLSLTPVHIIDKDSGLISHVVSFSNEHSIYHDVETFKEYFKLAK